MSFLPGSDAIERVQEDETLMRKLLRFAPMALLVLTIGLGCRFWLVPTYLQPQTQTLQACEAWIQQNGQTVIASQPNNAPFNFSSDGILYNGFDQELLNNLEMTVGADFQLVPMSLQDAQNALSRGEIDGIIGQQASPELAALYAITQPDLSTAQAIFVLNDRADIHGLSDLAKRTMAIVSESPAAYRMASNAAVDGVQGNSLEDTVNRLLSGEIEVLVGLAAVIVVAFYAWAQSMRTKMNERTHKLHETEQRQRVLIENANDAIFSVHPADTSILEANRKAEQLTGYRRESLLHMRLSDLFDQESRERSVGRLNEVLLKGSGNFDDMVFTQRNGTRIDVDASASVIEFDRRKVIQILARDVTERKEMERELVRRNRNLSALNAISATVGRSLELDKILDATLDKVQDVVGADMGAIYLFDEGAGNLVLRVYRGEPPVLAVHSQSLTEENSPVVITATNGNTAHAAGAWWPGTLQPNLGSFVSTQLRAKDKLLGVMNVASRKQRWFTQEDVDLLTAVANQISVAIENAILFTNLRTAIGDLFVVKQFNENALQSMTNGLITVDMMGRISSVNVAATRIIGYAKEQLLGRTVRQVLVSSNGLEHLLAEAMHKGVPCTNRETVITHRDGSEIPVGLNTSPLRDNQGVVTGLLLVFDDLSERKRMEAERRKMNRLEDLVQMSAILAHELRNPLGAISMGIQHLAHKINDEAQQRSIQMIMDESERLNRIIDNVLMISKPPSLELAPAQVAETVDATVTRWQGAAAERRVRITKNYTPDVGQCLIDPLRMDQALNNLMGNALDAMPNGGDLRITVRKVRLLPEPSTALQVVGKGSQDTAIGPEEWIRIEIADTGVGIVADKLPKIFEPFVTTKAKGTGLGLAITHRIIKDHRGNISVRSKEGVGTVFTIDLPLAE
jgi:PAS domain S-box-containing protein